VNATKHGFNGCFIDSAVGRVSDACHLHFISPPHGMLSCKLC
jgi:hypothetical protein